MFDVSKILDDFKEEFKEFGRSQKVIVKMVLIRMYGDSMIYYRLPISSLLSPLLLRSHTLYHVASNSFCVPERVRFLGKTVL